MKLDNINKSYENKHVISDFSFDFEKGKSYCLYGKSGCGKTTLLNIIMGIENSDSGSVINSGKIRAVFQESRLLAWRTVSENITVAGGDESMAKQMLGLLGLSDELDSYPQSLSGGMRRRVSVVRALCSMPDILLLDEPFNGLDDTNADTAMKLIKENMKDKTVILVTHNLSQAEKMVDEVIYLSDSGMKITDVVSIG